MKTYYECHITMMGDIKVAKEICEDLKWKFSAIDGDANLGNGVKLYATRQLNSRLFVDDVVSQLLKTADKFTKNGLNVIRRKVETVLYDDRSSLVRPCDGSCPECIT